MLTARTSPRLPDAAPAHVADSGRVTREAGHPQGIRWIIPLDLSPELG